MNEQIVVAFPAVQNLLKRLSHVWVFSPPVDSQEVYMEYERALGKFSPEQLAYAGDKALEVWKEPFAPKPPQIADWASGSAYRRKAQNPNSTVFYKDEHGNQWGYIPDYNPSDGFKQSPPTPEVLARQPKPPPTVAATAAERMRKLAEKNPTKRQ